MVKRIVKFFRNGKCVIELKVFNGYISVNNNITFSQNLQFLCGMTHLSYSLKKLGKNIQSTEELGKTEMNHDEGYANIWKDKKDEWLVYVKKTFSTYCFFMCSIKKSSGRKYRDWNEKLFIITRLRVEVF